MRAKCFSCLRRHAAATFCAAGATAQSSRITQPVDNQQRTVLAGNLHPKALAAAAGRQRPGARGAVARDALHHADACAIGEPAGRPGKTAGGTADARLAELSSLADAGRIRAALRRERCRYRQDHPVAQQQGLHVVSVARGRSWIAASGTAAQVEAAFQTEIHSYLVDGETHYRECIGAVRARGVRLGGERHSRPERFPHEAAAAPVRLETKLRQAELH